MVAPCLWAFAPRGVLGVWGDRWFSATRIPAGAACRSGLYAVAGRVLRAVGMDVDTDLEVSVSPGKMSGSERQSLPADGPYTPGFREPSMSDQPILRTVEF